MGIGELTAKYLPCPPIPDPLLNPSISVKGSLTSAKTTNRLHHMIPTETLIYSTMKAVIDQEEVWMRAMGLSPAKHDTSDVKGAAKRLRASIDERLQDFIGQMPTWDSTKEAKVYTSVDLTTRVDTATFNFSLLFPPRLVVPITVTTVCQFVFRQLNEADK